MIDRDKCIKLIAETREFLAILARPLTAKDSATYAAERLGPINSVIDRHASMTDQLEGALNHISILESEVASLHRAAPNFSHVEMTAQRNEFMRQVMELMAENRRLRTGIDSSAEIIALKEAICAASTVLSRGPNETLKQAAERVAVACMDRARERNAAQWEADRMHPVVKAAEVWLESPAKGLGSHAEFALADAVGSYRKNKP